MKVRAKSYTPAQLGQALTDVIDSELRRSIQLMYDLHGMEQAVDLATRLHVPFALCKACKVETPTIGGKCFFCDSIAEQAK